MLIKTLKNQTIFLPNSGISKIIDIKQKIFDISGFPIINQTLYCESKILDDNKNISYYHLNDMTTINMAFSLNGGGKGAINNRGRHDNYTGKRELVLAKEGETVYAIVKTICGNKRVIVIRIDNGATVSGRISGSIHAWIKKDDVVLVGLRDFQEDKVDVVWRYTQEETRKLCKAGYIPQNTVVNKNMDNDTSSNIEFYDNHNKESRDVEGNDHIINEKNARRYEMPSSDDSSDQEQETGSNPIEDLTDKIYDRDEHKKNTDDINIDNI
jgi:translation initiation factor 1A